MPKPETRRDSPPPRRSNWSNSDRRSRLPPDWEKIRKRVLRRDNRECQQELPDGGGICGEYATDVDHIDAGDDHRESNLQALCGPHHRSKSSREGAQALKAKRTKISKRFVITEEHPGMI
jgi:5-methylcytosine-specific restriction protein A